MNLLCKKDELIIGSLFLLGRKHKSAARLCSKTAGGSEIFSLDYSISMKAAQRVLSWPMSDVE